MEEAMLVVRTSDRVDQTTTEGRRTKTKIISSPQLHPIHSYRLKYIRNPEPDPISLPARNIRPPFRSNECRDRKQKEERVSEQS